MNRIAINILIRTLLLLIFIDVKGEFRHYLLIIDMI